MSNLRATSAANAAATKPRRFKFWLIVYGILGCGAIALAFASQNLFIGTTETPIAPENPPSRPQQAPQKPAETTPPKQQEGKAQPPRENPSLVDDDGKTLWVSPTSGPPLDLAYLSPGAQILAVLRPAALLKPPEGEKVRAALGPVAQAAIERVYWSHRVWPEQNGARRPSFDQTMSTRRLREKVQDYLAKSEALEVRWSRPVTSDELQRELDRMARNTRDGRTLEELFAALHGDAAHLRAQHLHCFLVRR